jgi:Holliday junction resolvase RusA-like endonuclease
MLPFEFTVPGPPVSHQSGNKGKLAAWRKMVRSAAGGKWGRRAPCAEQLKITVTYYHEGEAIRLDNGNMVKPIQDALIGLVYADDRLVTDTVVHKTSINGVFRVRGASRVLLEAFAAGDEFLHVIIDRAPGHEDPLR